MLSAAYSTNCVTFDPKGKILQVSSLNLISAQIDYAREAVKQGSTSLALKSKTHVVSISFEFYFKHIDSTQSLLTNFCFD